MKKLHPTAAKLLVDIAAYRDRVGIDRTTFGKEAAGDGHFITRVEGGKLPRLDTIDRVYRYMDSKTKAVRKAASRIAPLLLLALLVAPAFAQVDYIVPRIPSEAEKVEALKRAYILNGNSMVGGKMIDLTDPDPLKKTDLMPTLPLPRLIKPVKAELKNELDEQADLNMDDLRKHSRRFVMKTDVCARHGKRKVITRGGKSWRCK
jgi:hypothetical protein